MISLPRKRSKTNLVFSSLGLQVFLFQFAPEDVIFMELNAKFDLKIFLINPGDEIFVPMNIWPISPPEQQLRSKNEYIQIELKKESKVSRKNCNDSLDYVYGGKLFD